MENNLRYLYEWVNEMGLNGRADSPTANYMEHNFGHAKQHLSENRSQLSLYKWFRLFMCRNPGAAKFKLKCCHQCFCIRL